MYRHLFITCIIVFATLRGMMAQSQVRVSAIDITGNEKTKDAVILREITFGINDIIPFDQVNDYLHSSEQQLISTGLFNSVTSSAEYNKDSTTVNVSIALIENWYFFPVPIAELIDRNINVWWNEFNHSFKRINYGLKLSHYNMVGYHDKLTLNLQAGYLRKAEVKYDIPNLLFENTVGFGINLFYADSKETGYVTEANKTLFHRTENDDVVLTRFRAGLSANFRPNTYQKQIFRLEYHRNKIHQEIADLNPDYFLVGRTEQQFLVLEWDIDYDRTNYTLYPTDGYQIGINIKKEGIGIFNDVDNTFFSATLSGYKSISETVSVASRWRLRTHLTENKIPYANNTGLGYSDFIVIGYDLFVIDGPQYAAARNHISWKCFNTRIQLFNLFPKSFRSMPITVYTRFNYDIAYVNDPTYHETNTLNNTWISGYGPAIDVLLYNNYLMSAEYGFIGKSKGSLNIKMDVSF